jgi:(4-alkanoyl-5-oxo-2,5-dihydrofuran-3-yl)methyl phosphate reductase
MYLITGATGNVGREVVNQLLGRGAKVRVFTRDAAKVTQLGDRVEVAIGDQTSPESFARALAGVEAVFLMNGALDGAAFRELIATAKSNGSPRVVFLSTLFAGDPESPIGRIHKDKEDVIRASGLPGKFVRAGAFMTNAFQWLGSIKAEGAVFNSMGAGKAAPVAPEDIAAVAVKAMTDSTSSPEIYEVTGSELLSVPEQVGLLAKARGKAIQCVDVTIEAATQGLLRAGVPGNVASAVAQSFEDVRTGKMAIVKDTVAKVTGRSPRSFESWAKENALRFA